MKKIAACPNCGHRGYGEQPVLQCSKCQGLFCDECVPPHNKYEGECPHCRTRFSENRANVYAYLPGDPRYNYD